MPKMEPFNECVRLLLLLVINLPVAFLVRRSSYPAEVLGLSRTNSIYKRLLESSGSPTRIKDVKVWDAYGEADE